jgi:NADPH:quinone reductase
MRCVICRSFAPLSPIESSGVVIEERPTPDPSAGQVRVRVGAAGLNFADALFVQGLYQIKPPLPFVPGNEIAGVVDAVGDGVDGWTVGERVFANVGLGGFATHVVVDARRLMRTPDSMTDGQAATFSQSYLTAWFALSVRAKAQVGNSLLVLGAGGGVGLAAVDVGAALGLRVIAAASTTDKRAVAIAHGAEVAIDPTTEDLKTRVRELTGAGVDLVYDPVGGALADPALRCLRDFGQFLVIGFASGAIPALPANQVLLRNRTVTGVDWGGWVAQGNYDANQQLIQQVVDLIASDRLHPVEPSRYALDDAAQALADQHERRITGKACLIP